ncbi:MAG TPA: phosphatase PAP2 family protein [Polyangia bacterium]|nr:phosphatase PAP2 family protein [Polyangia bacterium]
MKRSTWTRGSRTVAAVAAAFPLALGGLAPATARAAEPAPKLTESEHFTIDPIVDGSLVVGAATFDYLLGLVLSSGEIVPQAPGSSDKLSSIDRWAVTQTIDPHADRNSTIGLYGAYGYALLDSVLTGVRDGKRSGLVDGVLYAEAITITGAFTSATKIGVRRPRPLDYANCAPDTKKPGADCSSTDLQLSFFSGHASTTGAIASTATYLAFTRAGWRSPRPWITLGVGTALTAFVSYERVRSGKHFPTDVIMGSMAGAGIGLMVAHLHRRPHYHEDQLETPSVIVGYAPMPGGGSVNAEWRF